MTTHSIIAVLVVLTTAIPGGAGESSGHVIICGQEVTPPWNFSGQGEDTLRLNGIPYSPVRCKPKRRPAKVSELTKAQHALSVASYEAAKNATTYAEKLRISAEALRSSDLVDSVTIEDWGLCVYWHGQENTEDVIIPRFETRQRSQSEIHQERIDDFWQTMNSGSLLIIFDGQTLTIPRIRVLQTLALIDAFRARRVIPDSLYLSSDLRAIPRQKLEYYFCRGIN